MTQKAENPQPSMVVLAVLLLFVGLVFLGLIAVNDATADRLRRIAEAAYRRAQARNFAPGHDLEDWLEAEKEIDAGLQGRPAP